MGVRIALDDFGSGYSSLSSLDKYPIDVLKIDKCFIDLLGESSSRSEIVRTMIHLATALRLQITAEGVERQQQEEILRGLGCQIAQGYFYSRPRPAEEISEQLLHRTTQQPVIS